VREDGDRGGVHIAVAHANNRAGRTFPSMPRSKNHTSPRRGVVFLSFQFAKELIGSQGRFSIIQRSGIKRRRPAQELRGENPRLLFGRRELVDVCPAGFLLADDFGNARIDFPGEGEEIFGFHVPHLHGVAAGQEFDALVG
jgi:hypothetical protein